MTRKWNGTCRYEIRNVDSLPCVRGIRKPLCMVGPSWVRRIWRSASRRNCCRHHRIDWHLASETAISIVLQAEADGVPPGSVFLEEHAADGDDLEALVDLLAEGAGIEIAGSGRREKICEGHHRIAAMRDAGVRRTVIQRLELTPAWKTGSEADGDGTGQQGGPDVHGPCGRNGGLP